MRRKGFTLVEVMAGLTLMSMVLIGVVSLFITGFRSYYRTSAQVELSQKNAQGLRQVSEALKNAMDVAVSADGKTLTYTMPLKTATPDAVTGEKEFIDPLTSDGVVRTFAVTAAGKLTNGGSRAFVSKIAATDPDTSSSRYGQTYKPFSLATVGSTKTLTINLITQQSVRGKNQFARMKTTLLLRNSK